MSQTLQQKAEYRQNYRAIIQQRNLARSASLWPNVERFVRHLGILGGKNEWEKGYDQAVYDIRSNLRDILKRAEALPIAAPPPTGTLEPLRESIKLAMEHIKGQRNISALEVLEAALAATPPAS